MTIPLNGAQQKRKMLLNNVYVKKKKLHGKTPSIVFGISHLNPHNLLASILVFSFLKVKKSFPLKS